MSKSFKKGLTNLIQSTESRHTSMAAYQNDSKTESQHTRKPAYQNDSKTRDEQKTKITKQKVTYYMEPELIKRLKIAAAKNETGLSTMVTKALIEYLPKYE